MTKFRISALAFGIVLVAGRVAFAAEADHSGHRMMMDQGGMSPDRMMEHMDTDKNGTISEAEFAEGAKRHFKEMDTNGDGQISRDEIQSCMQSHCGGMMGEDQGGAGKHTRGHSAGGGMGMGGMVTTHPMEGGH